VILTMSAAENEVRQTVHGSGVAASAVRNACGNLADMTSGLACASIAGTPSIPMASVLAAGWSGRTHAAPIAWSGRVTTTGMTRARLSAGDSGTSMPT